MSYVKFGEMFFTEQP